MYRVNVIVLNQNLQISENCLWPASWQNQQNDLCAQPRLRSAWAPPSLFRIFTVLIKKYWVLSYLLTALTEDWSDWVDAQADLSLCSAHRSFCWFCHEMAHILFGCQLPSWFQITVIKLPPKVRLVWALTWQNQQSEFAPSEDSDQPGHLPSLIRVFTVLMKKPWALSYPLSAQRRLWPDWADAQADLRLCWAHTHYVGFVMSQLILRLSTGKITIE